MTKRDEAWQLLLTGLDAVEQHIPLNQLADKIGLHYTSVGDMLNIMKLITELPFRVKILKLGSRKIVLKEENMDSNKSLHLKLNNMLNEIKKLEKLLKKP